MIKKLALWAAVWVAAQSLNPPLLWDAFSYSDGLITNEFAHWFPSNPAAVVSPIWELTSGSLFAATGKGWTGVPDDTNPNALSTTNTGSSVFRAVTRRSDFLNVSLTFRLLNQGLSSKPSTPAVAWDGCHIILRYQSEFSLYYASINRRDNRVIIKKKVPGGPSNGGTYYNLTPLKPYVVPYNTWQDIKATISTNADSSVTISLYAQGQLLASAIDDGTVGGPPILMPGRAGVRGDNADLKFDDFSIAAVPGLGSSTPKTTDDGDARATQRFLSPALADGINDTAQFGPAAQRVSIYSLRGHKIFEAARQSAALIWPGRDGSGRLVETGVYIAQILKADGSYCYQSFAVVK